MLLLLDSCAHVILGLIPSKGKKHSVHFILVALPYQIILIAYLARLLMCKVNVTHIIKKRNWKLMQIRPMCGHYTRVNIPLESEKYWRE